MKTKYLTAGYSEKIDSNIRQFSQIVRKPKVEIEGCRDESK
jgi:hypothetical protein